MARGMVEGRVSTHIGLEGHGKDFGDNNTPSPYTGIIKGCDVCETLGVVSAQ